MNHARLLLTSSAVFLVLASCDQSRPPGAGAAPGGSPDDLAAERALIEEGRMALERERLEEERMHLEEDKEALQAEREARLAAREQDVESADLSLEERQRQLAEREFELGRREGEIGSREASLSEQELHLAGRDSLDDWQPAPLPEMQQPVADYDTFYEDLQPYGSWYETPDYGYVYQPTVVVRDPSWRPYTRGRWACTNLGWNWVSEEPFGWACFHYGRWALLHGRGWVWVPGDEWAPSWVCWREGGEHVGWAPLPPETLCDRGRGWDRSVEAEFGIGARSFTFVHRRHMADPLWRHCLPVEQNPRCIGQTTNITNIRFHQDRIIAGGPGYEHLRRDVGKAWPVYQVKTDRFEAIRDRNRRNASVRGNQLAVFAPNLNTRWNDRLKPSTVAGRWDEVKVVRAENGIKRQWTDRFREMRAKRKVDSSKSGDFARRQTLLEENRSKVVVAQRKEQEKQQQMNEARRGKHVPRREFAQEAARRSPVKGRPTLEENPAVAEKESPHNIDREPTLAERQRQAAQRLRETRSRRNGTPTSAAIPAQEEERNVDGTARMREESQQRDHAWIAKQPEDAGPPREEPEDVREGVPGGKRVDEDPAGRGTEPSGRRLREQAPTENDAVAGNDRRTRLEEAVRQREQARNEKERGDLRRGMEKMQLQQQEEIEQQQERASTEAAENKRRGRMEESRQQQEAASAKAEQSRQEQAERQLELDAASTRQMEEARAQEEESRREAEENSRRKQEEMMRRQEEQIRQQQEEKAREQEQMRQQEKARRQAEERARQEQEERARRQQEELARQQEQMRRQEEEARRQAEERARQEQEERARLEQEERARQQEQARQQQEQDKQRRQDERARERQEKQEQPRQRGR